MWRSIIKTDQVDSQGDQITPEALRALHAQMQRAAESGERLQILVNKAIDSVPTQLHGLILSGRATFAPTYDDHGRLIEISIVPKE